MAYITCSKCGEPMDMIEEDSRQEWREQVFHCEDCNKTVTRRTEYDQIGLVISDRLSEDVD